MEKLSFKLNYIEEFIVSPQSISIENDLGGYTQSTDLFSSCPFSEFSFNATEPTTAIGSLIYRMGVGMVRFY